MWLYSQIKNILQKTKKYLEMLGKIKTDLQALTTG